MKHQHRHTPTDKQGPPFSTTGGGVIFVAPEVPIAVLEGLLDKLQRNAGNLRQGPEEAQSQIPGPLQHCQDSIGANIASQIC